ncbi:MAG: hypothetical protein ACPH97_01635, partial [Flavobacteriales bacterium]
MNVRLMLWFLVWACSLPLASLAQAESAPENVSSFLKDMERKASELGSDEARWVRRDFSSNLEKEVAGEARRQQVIRVVRALESNRTRFSQAVMGYLRGANVLLEQEDWSRWNAWHAQIDFFLTNPKERKESEAFLA